MIEITEQILKSAENFKENLQKYKEGKLEAKALIGKYATFESFSENPDLYYDFDSKDKFSVGK